MRKGTWKTNPTDLGIVQEPEGPPVLWAASPGVCRKPVSTAMNMRPCGSSLGPCLSLTGARFYDIAVSLQESPVPGVTLTVLRVYQPDGLQSKFTGKKN